MGTEGHRTLGPQDPRLQIQPPRLQPPLPYQCTTLSWQYQTRVIKLKLFHQLKIKLFHDHIFHDIRKLATFQFLFCRQFPPAPSTPSTFSDGHPLPGGTPSRSPDEPPPDAASPSSSRAGSIPFPSLQSEQPEANQPSQLDPSAALAPTSSGNR